MALSFVTPLALFLSFLPFFCSLSVALNGPARLVNRAPSDVVAVASTTSYCLIVPKDANTSIGDSEYPGGMTTYCTAGGGVGTGTIPANFWTSQALVDGVGVNGQDYRQLTGCIDPTTLDRLNPNDHGGQYDSSGGIGGRGNPEGSSCAGYAHYVELIEPAGRRACIRCCQDPADCPLDQDTSGCPVVIPADYNC